MKNNYILLFSLCFLSLACSKSDPEPKTPPIGELKITSVAGGNGFGSGTNQLALPSGIFVDAQYNVYVADEWNHRVQKWAPNAKEGVTVAGNGKYGNGANQLYFPTDVYVDRKGNVYVTDNYNHRVQKWAPGAKEGVTVAKSYYPGSIFVDDAGNIYVMEELIPQVKKWAPGATQGQILFSLGQFSLPEGITVDRQGNIYTTDLYYDHVKKWSPGATEGVIVAGANSSRFNSSDDPDKLFNPTDIYVDANGNMYITDSGNHRVQKWAPGATEGVTVIKGNGKGAAMEQFDFMTGIFIDDKGHTYISDINNDRVQKWK